MQLVGRWLFLSQLSRKGMHFLSNLELRSLFLVMFDYLGSCVLWGVGVRPSVKPRHALEAS